MWSLEYAHDFYAGTCYVCFVYGLLSQCNNITPSRNFNLSRIDSICCVVLGCRRFARGGHVTSVDKTHNFSLFERRTWTINTPLITLTFPRHHQERVWKFSLLSLLFSFSVSTENLVCGRWPAKPAGKWKPTEKRATVAADVIVTRLWLWSKLVLTSFLQYSKRKEHF